MGNTNLDSEGVEDNVYFGFSTVSVNPGWRTSKGWVAEAVMNASIKFEPARTDVKERFIDTLTNRYTLSDRALFLLYHDLGSNERYLQWPTKLKEAPSISNSKEDDITNEIPPQLWIEQVPKTLSPVPWSQLFHPWWILMF